MAKAKTAIAATTMTLATEYDDFVIHASRANAKQIKIKVYKSPAGAMPADVFVTYSEKESTELKNSFRIGDSGGSGRAMITEREATEIGKRMATILFPTEVYQLLTKSLGIVTEKKTCGLRIRLVMDETLVDLPWEYIYRPDCLNNEGVSGFLLLDPSISIVREADDPRIELTPISGQQHLTFVGTLWEGNIDGWEVEKEYNELKEALKPVSKYLATKFITAHSKAFKTDLKQDTAIFHYAGHCDFYPDGKAYIVQQLPAAQKIADAEKMDIDILAQLLKKAKARLVVLSACNSGFWPVVKPLLEANVPALIGINGGVAAVSTIEFCAKLYESLSLGLTLDEAISTARLHILEWGRQYGLFDWGLFMIYMPSQQATLFPRRSSAAIAERQKKQRKENDIAINSSFQLIRALDKHNYAEIMSILIKHRVLILGRFTGRRLAILKAIQSHLAAHPNRYIPELFTYSKPDYRDLTESIRGFASMSRFIIADLSEPKSIPAELEAIVPHFQSIPVMPIINSTGKPYALFDGIKRKPNVATLLRYNNETQLMDKLDKEIVTVAEQKLQELKPA
jgi:hypothetical protein